MAGRKIALAVVFFVGASCGCRDRAGPVDPPRSFPRYWLANTTLVADGGARVEITSPVLVELLPEGRVRSVAASPPFDGALPAEILQEPQRQRGLMLYAERVSEIRWRRPDGPVLGRLHPGAFVSVVPADRGMVRIGSLPFERASDGPVVFVDREALGVEAREVAPLRPPEKFAAVRVPGVVGWLDDPATSRTEAAWTAVDCEDVWISGELRLVSQYVRGVELVGSETELSSWILKTGPVVFESLRCPARTVSQDGPRLVSIRSDGAKVSVERVPDGYRRPEPPSADPLVEARRREASLYWLLRTEEGLVCDEWKLARNGRLVRRKRLDRDGRPAIASFPTRYEPSTSAALPVLHLDSLELDGQQAMKCSCDYTYTLLRAAGDELEVTGRPLPDHLVAYDPADIERWFLSKERCAAVRDEVAAALARDATAATRLGLHAVVAAWGI